MRATTVTFPLAQRQNANGIGLVWWLRSHRGAVAMAALLAFAGPVTFFTGALSVMREPTTINVLGLGLWWTLFGACLWCLLLTGGYAGLRLSRHGGRIVRAGVWLLAAGLAAATANMVTAARATILIDQGLVQSVWTMYMHGFFYSLVMALLYFAHLRRSDEHEAAVGRLAAAQKAQREVRRSIVQAQLQEVQARIDPELLFDMLGAARRLYEGDAARAEQFIDGLIVFLRAALPRLRNATSSLLREAELAAAYVRLQRLAGNAATDMVVAVGSDAMHARFPPGVLVPLLNRNCGKGGCRLTATRSADRCRVVLTVDATPSEAVLVRVRGLLDELNGGAAALRIECSSGCAGARATDVVVEVPYEHT